MAKDNLSTTDAMTRVERDYQLREVLVTDFEAEAENLSALLGMAPNDIRNVVNPRVDRYGVPGFTVVIEKAKDREKALAIRRRVFGS